jgi:hypothetical protein
MSPSSCLDTSYHSTDQVGFQDFVLSIEKVRESSGNLPNVSLVQILDQHLNKSDARLSAAIQVTKFPQQSNVQVASRYWGV